MLIYYNKAEGNAVTQLLVDGLDPLLVGLTGALFSTFRPRHDFKQLFIFFCDLTYAFFTYVYQFSIGSCSEIITVLFVETIFIKRNKQMSSFQFALLPGGLTTLFNILSFSYYSSKESVAGSTGFSENKLFNGETGNQNYQKVIGCQFKVLSFSEPQELTIANQSILAIAYISIQQQGLPAWLLRIQTTIPIPSRL